MCHFEIKHIVAEASHATSHRIALISFLFSLIVSKAQSLQKLFLFINCAFLQFLKTATQRKFGFCALTTDSDVYLETMLIRCRNSPKE